MIIASNINDQQYLQCECHVLFLQAGFFTFYGLLVVLGLSLTYCKKILEIFHVSLLKAVAQHIAK